ncbi:hypothetical protein D3C81_2009300 [compost metagenome]
MKVTAHIESGTAEAVIAVKETGAEKRIMLNDLNGQDSPYTWDVSDFPADAKLTLRIYAEKAKGKFEMKWEQ